jgi:hypothetical protein
MEPGRVRLILDATEGVLFQQESPTNRRALIAALLTQRGARLYRGL